jgi:hypothetical protein
MSKSKGNRGKASKDAAQTTPEAPAEQPKRIAVAGFTVAAVAATIGAAITSIVTNLNGADVGFRTVIDGVLSVARRAMEGGDEPEIIQTRVASLFSKARDAIVAALDEQTSAEWQGFLPTANPSPNKADRKAKGLPSKDRLNARDVRVLARRAGTLSAGVRQAHDAFEATYNFATKASRIVEALLTVPDFAAQVEQYQTKKANGIDYELSASGLLDAAKMALKVPAEDGEDATPEGDAVPDTLDAIIARTVAQLRAIGRGDAADAILATVAGLATPVEVVVEVAAE